MNRWWSWLRPLNQLDIDEHPRNKETRDFTKNFKPNKDIDYSWVYDHSKLLFDDISIMVRNLDIKAENLLKYLAPGSGLIGIILIWINSHSCNTTNVNILIAISMGLLALSFLSCLFALMPHQQASVPSVKDAIESAEYYESKNEALAKFSTGIASAVIVKLIVNSRKAVYVNIAYWLYAIAVIMTILCVILLLW